jgi:hypothetical protein
MVKRKTGVPTENAILAVQAGVIASAETSPLAMTSD